MIRGACLLAAGVTAALMFGGASGVGTAGATPAPDVSSLVVTFTISAAAQAAAVRYWTPARLAAVAGPPRGTANASGFGGVPTVGALFLSASASENVCTASVVDSAGHDLLLTAAHCVDYGGGGNYGQNLVFIPGWYRGHRPYGVWPVRSITVSKAWNASADVNDDFAFLTVSPPRGQHEQIQQVTGGLRLDVNSGYRHSDIVPIGYDMSGGGVPVMCRAKSFYARPDQQEFLCDGYTNGASGGPWITGFNTRTGTGTVIGDIGGYQQGGDLAWTGFSPYFTSVTERLYRQAERALRRAA
jgi:hypothetical protein